MGATESGYQMLPLLGGLIFSSITTGQLISRTGRYKAIIVGGIALMTVGVFLLSGLHANTDIRVFWFWMFITGLGIGPTMSAFTLIVQNAVPVQQLGVATSNLTFFRQIGGSVGLAVLGTLFATSLRDQLPAQVKPVLDQMTAGVPPSFQQQWAAFLSSFGGSGSQSLDLNEFTGVDQSFGGSIASVAAKAAEAQQAGTGAGVTQLFAPYVDKLDHAFFEAFSLGMGQVFAFGVATTAGAVILSLLIREIPLRRTMGRAPAGATAGGPAGAATGAPGATPGATPDAAPSGAPAGTAG